MVDRRKPTTRKRTGRVNQKPAGPNAAGTSLVLPNIAQLIADGEITVGVLHPIGCVATANDSHNCLAMLVRRRGESLTQLLTRLDRAIAKAFNEDIFTDEVNAPATTS